MSDLHSTSDESPELRRRISMIFGAMSGRMGLSRTGFARSVFILSGGAAFGQLLGLIAMPVLARLYGPSEFGVFGIYTSALAIISVVAMLRYESAIPISETDSEAVNVTALSCGIAVLASLVCALLVFLSADPATTLVQVPNLASVAWLLPIGVLGISAYQAFSMWAIRTQDFPTLARTKVAQGGGLILTQVGLGILRVGSPGLIIGRIVGHGVGATALARRVYEQNRDWFQAVSWAGMIQVARRYSRFPRFSAGAALLDSLSDNLPLLFLGTVLSVTIAGWYTFLQQTLLYPVNLLTANIAQVYHGEIVRLRRTDPQALPVVFLRRVRQTASLGLAIVIAVNLIAPWLVPLIFGERWSGAVTCLQIISPMVFVSFVASPTGSTPEALQRQDLHLVRDVVRITMVILALSAAYLLRAHWVAALGVISAAGVISNAFYLWISWLAIRSYVRKPPVLEPDMHFRP